MFVNAILHHEVPVFDEKTAKFLPGVLCRDSFQQGLPAWQSPLIDGYKISAYERTAPPDDTSANPPLTPVPPSHVPQRTTRCSPANRLKAAESPLWRGALPGWWFWLRYCSACWREGTRRPLRHTIQPLAAYAANLPLSQLAMSESTSLSGGKSTFIDGHIQNTGDQTVSGITVQVLFRNNEAMPPQIETLPLSLIRTREPYIDTQPVSAAPLKPGDERDFRLIFESLPAKLEHANARDPHHPGRVQNNRLDAIPPNSDSVILTGRPGRFCGSRP